MTGRRSRVQDSPTLEATSRARSAGRSFPPSTGSANLERRPSPPVPRLEQPGPRGSPALATQLDGGTLPLGRVRGPRPSRGV
jgi:hypothetical protein